MRNLGHKVIAALVAALVGDMALAQWAIGNRVFADANADGKRQSTEAGIANVKITLLGEQLAPVTTTVSDANGYYRFAGLASGLYILQVDASNFRDSGPLVGYRPSGIYRLGDNNNHLIESSVTVLGLRSVAVRLGPLASSPTGETDLGPGDIDIPDGYADLTVDFGITPPPVAPEPPAPPSPPTPPPTPPAPPTPAPHPAAAAYAIGNRVGLAPMCTLGADRLGLLNGQHVGIEGVTVQLSGTDIEARSTTTDLHGYYRFEGVMPGRYLLTILFDRSMYALGVAHPISEMAGDSLNRFNQPFSFNSGSGTTGYFDLPGPELVSPLLDLGPGDSSAERANGGSEYRMDAALRLVAERCEVSPVPAVSPQLVFAMTFLILCSVYCAMPKGRRLLWT